MAQKAAAGCAHACVCMSGCVCVPEGWLGAVSGLLLSPWLVPAGVSGQMGSCLTSWIAQAIAFYPVTPGRSLCLAKPLQKGLESAQMPKASAVFIVGG